MLATLVIGLREGLEAALIVGIIAAFLTRNGRGLAAMWWGVGAAVAASLAVGAGLWAFEAALPQAAQEGLETIIGAVAVVFVTGMIIWMSGHARTMKRDLETSASEALGTGTARALAVMAFLAVLKEGFETSVFLLATFRAAVTPVAAAAGALIGIAVSVGIGVGIYHGGVRLNLARFFRITGVFLLLVAAGLTLTAVRTAHEAGWLDGGQQRTADLSWLAPPGSVQASLVTGVLGIPADPRLIEVVAWVAYLIPVGIVMFLPEGLKPRGRAAVRTRFGIAAALAGAGAAVAVAASAALAPVPAPPLRLAGGGTAALRGDRLVLQTGGAATAVTLGTGEAAERRGATATAHTATVRSPSEGPASLSLAELVADNRGRVPVGIDPARDTGPFDATWTASRAVSAWTAAGRLVDVQTSTTRVLTVAGGGLSSARTLTVGAPVLAAATTASARGAARAAAADATAGVDRLLWVVQVPLVLALAGLLLGAVTLLRLRRARAVARSTSPVPGSTTYALE